MLVNLAGPLRTVYETSLKGKMTNYGGKNACQEGSQHEKTVNGRCHKSVIFVKNVSK
jgi:hypothetical protein